MLVVSALYAFGLDFPATQYYDEVYHVKTAREFLTLSGNTDTSHPPLGKILIMLSMRVFGDHSWVWRSVPLAAGMGVLFLFFLLAENFSKIQNPLYSRPFFSAWTVS